MDSATLTESLIKFVIKHPCLYDYRILDYKNIAKKTRLWRKIAKDLNQSSHAIRVKWKSLKDGYTKYKKKRKGTENWVWGPQLSFLDTAIQPRFPTTSVEGPRDDAVVESFYSTRPPFLSVDALDSKDDDFSSPSSTKQSFLSPASHSSTTRRPGDQENYVEMILNYLSTKDTNDPIDLLFSSYAKTLKGMKPMTQASLKLKLAQIFAEAELEEMQSVDSPPQISPYTIVGVAFDNENDIKREKCTVDD